MSHRHWWSLNHSPLPLTPLKTFPATFSTWFQSTYLNIQPPAIRVMVTTTLMPPNQLPPCPPTELVARALVVLLACGWIIQHQPLQVPIPCKYYPSLPFFFPLSYGCSCTIDEAIHNCVALSTTESIVCCCTVSSAHRTALSVHCIRRRLSSKHDYFIQ